MSETIVIIVTVFLSAFFSGMEIAFVSANKISLEMDKSKDTITSSILNVFSSNPEQYIATMLVGNNIALVLYGIAFARLLEPSIEMFIQSDVIVLLIQTIISTILILFTAEFLPKTLFRINSNGFLKFLAIPVFLFYILLYPIANIAMFLSKTLIKIVFKKSDSQENKSTVFSKVDLDHYVNQPDNNNTNEEEREETEIKLFKNALDFSNVKIRDCMVPRTDIQAIEESCTIEELIEIFIATGYSKILVFKESIDHIIGYVHTSQIFNNTTSLKNIIYPILVVPETIQASKLLGNFTQTRKTIAVVVDEFGGTSGLVTTEDILEEIFGEIEDEHDSDDLTLKNIKEDEWIISGRYEIDFLNESYNFNLPKTDDYDTVAGLIINFQEDIPKINTIIKIKNFEFRILKASDIRIELVLMKIVGNN